MLKRIRSYLVVAAISLAVGAVVVWMYRPTPPPTYRYAEVSVADMLEGEPELELGWLDRAVWREREPAQRAVAPGGAKDVVIEFCRPTTKTMTKAQPDSVDHPDIEDLTAVLLKARETGSWIPFKGSRLDLWGALSNGDRFHDTYTDVQGDVEYGVDGGETFLREKRLGAIKEHGPEFVVGAAAGLLACPFIN